MNAGDILDVQAGGQAVSPTIKSGGTEIVEAGGKDSSAIVQAGGTQSVSGTTSDAQVSGTQTIKAGGIGSDELVQAGGRQIVAGMDSGAEIYGTLVVNSGGSVSGDTIESGGSATIRGGAIASQTSVDSGGILEVRGTGKADGVTLSGGTLELQTAKADAGATGTLAFSGSNSKLVIDVAQPTIPTFSEIISGFAKGDIIDEKGLAFSGATLRTSVANGNTDVTITGGNGSGSQTFTFSGTGSGLPLFGKSSYALAADGSGGTELVVKTTPVINRPNTSFVNAIHEGVFGQAAGGGEQTAQTAANSGAASTAVAANPIDHSSSTQLTPKITPGLHVA